MIEGQEEEESEAETPLPPPMSMEKKEKKEPVPQNNIDSMMAVRNPFLNRSRSKSQNTSCANLTASAIVNPSVPTNANVLSEPKKDIFHSIDFLKQQQSALAIQDDRMTQGLQQLTRMVKKAQTKT